MARNKYPEQSRERILSAAKSLFLENGFDRTTIQDIIDRLGGMTKGVIYHHFKSKADILEAILGENDARLLEEEWQGDNALEKIRYMMAQSLNDYKKISTLYSMQISFKSPTILSEQYRNAFQLLIPKLKSAIEEGIREGSITTDYPEEIAELIILYFNFAVGLRIKDLTKEEINRKFTFVKSVFDGLNIPLISEEIVSQVQSLSEYISELKNKK
ncbi:MAG: TetR/AcrR family transcriptional regulator [Peptostreptococcaceae bacterium]|nr:TetR/AcrR family transcriptional regulator [Peptostreptococcaceae bacterium]